jgi:hypothetical protein
MKLFSKYIYLILIQIFFHCFYNHSFSQIMKNNAAITYPVPAKSDNLLFYVQRNYNTNTIVYCLNILPNGKINKIEPIHPYWINFENRAKKEELTYMQKNYAYGLESKVTNSDNFIINFVSYKKRYIYLMKSVRDNSYKAYIFINGVYSELRRIFVKIDGGTFWVPIVKYIELYGIDNKTGKDVYEKIIP